MNLDLSTDTAPYPERTLQLAETFAEIVRVLNHQTRHHEALRYPAEAGRVVRELASAAGRLPQLLGQVCAWLQREEEAGTITAPPGAILATGVMAAQMRLQRASQIAEELQEALDFAAQVTCDLSGAETGGEEGGDGADG